MTKREEVEYLFEKLDSYNSHDFSKQEKASTEEGVYIILSPKNKVLHVGKTRAACGIRQGLQYHMAMNGDSSFTLHYLGGNGGWLLRDGYRFKYIEEEDDEIRAYLEVYATWRLWPEHFDVD